jgi:nucleotide-binding universal stress UspA family protein
VLKNDSYRHASEATVPFARITSQHEPLHSTIHEGPGEVAVTEQSLDGTPPAGSYAHIACCVEQSEGSLAALAEAARIRSLGPGRLSVLHVIELPPGTAGLEAMPLIEPDPIGATREWLTELVAPISGAEPILVHHGGHAATTACKRAEEARVDSSSRERAADGSIGSCAGTSPVICSPTRPAPCFSPDRGADGRPARRVVRGRHGCTGGCTAQPTHTGTRMGKRITGLMEDIGIEDPDPGQ